MMGQKVEEGLSVRKENKRCDIKENGLNIKGEGGRR